MFIGFQLFVWYIKVSISKTESFWSKVDITGSQLVLEAVIVSGVIEINNAATEEMAARAEEVSAVASNLPALAKQMKSMVNRFKANSSSEQ